MRVIAILTTEASMNMCFIQKRIDKKIVFWDTGLHPTENVWSAARYNGGDNVLPMDIGTIIRWVAHEVKNFQGVIIPVCTDDSASTVNLLCNLEEAYRRILPVSKEAFSVRDNLCFQCPREIADKVVEIWKKKDEVVIPW